MSRPLNVLFVSSEVEPFAKTGGLADVSGALPLAIKHLGHEIRAIMPRYGSIDGHKARLAESGHPGDILVPAGDKIFIAKLLSASLANNLTNVLTYFIDNQILFGGRPGLYVNPDTKSDYPDNDDRFIFFSRGVLETLKRLDWKPDIIHCNDWQTGLIPVYLKTIYRSDPFFARCKTVFTVHNMAYQGIFPPSSFMKTQLPAELMFSDSVTSSGDLNCLKAGLVFADAITTVSRKYAEEIQSDEFGCGLQNVTRVRSSNLHGILNGVDYSVWDPSADEFIPQRYTIDGLANKLENKRALLAKFGLPFNESTPLIGIISRLADQKGFDLLVPIFDELMKMNVQMIFLGTGEKKYHDLLERAQSVYPQQIGIRLGFDTPLAHLIEAGSDMFLMPSRYEPCGLNQIYSLRYGTVPIVRATGGLDDTIEDFRPETQQGTGFKFSRYDSGELLRTIHRALDMYKHRDLWNALIKNGMRKDYSWGASAGKYIELYNSLVSN